MPIRLAGVPHWRDDDYFECEIGAAPVQAGRARRRRSRRHSDKRELLADACALLFPIDWEEPFGLVMIEAMLSGTPVLAYARGAVPEMVEDGVTGFVCRDADEMAARLRAIGGFDRAALPAARARALDVGAHGARLREPLRSRASVGG